MLKHAVPTQMLTAETQTMLAWYDAYYNAFPEAKDIDFSELSTLVRMRSGNASPEAVAITLHLVEQLKQRPPDSSIQSITETLCELDLSGKVGAAVARFNNGEEVDLSYELQLLVAQCRRSMFDGTKASWENRSIMEYLMDDADEGGMQWSTFPVLLEGLKGLRKGDNIAVCAPTDQGKTSLLCRLAVDFQAQAKTLYPGQPLLYLVNEGTAARIVTRMYQTAVGQQRDAMIAMGQDALVEAYCSVVGAQDAIRCVNIHGKSMAQVAQIIERHEPHTVITDMTGRIRATSNKSGGMNDIGQLEEVWNDMREQAVIHDFAHIGTVQVSAEGFDQLYPPVSALQNSKTGIQTTLDLILMLGALRNPQAQGLRGISTPKNKLARSNKPGLNMFECYFDPAINVWRTGA